MWDTVKILQLKNACRKHKLPPFLCEYIQYYSQRPSITESWLNHRYVVLDTETTGLNPYADKIISLGAIIIYNQEIWLEESLEIIINPQVKLQPDNVAVHGLTQSDVAEGQAEALALEQLIRSIKGDIIVAHHAGFDKTIIENSLKQYYPSFFLHNLIVDTASLAFSIENSYLPFEYFNPKIYSLDSLCERYGIIPADRHTSWGDAFITAKLLLTLFNRLERLKKYQLRHLVL